MDARGGSPLGLPPDLLMLAASPPDAEHDGAELYEPDGLSASSSAAGAAVAAAGKSTHEPSSEVFRAHLVRRRRADGSEQIDAEGVVSLACYQKWLDTRGTGGKGKPGGRGMDTPEKVFQRTLTGCLTAADGRRPFDPDEEAAILRTLRQKRIWSVPVTASAARGPLTPSRAHACCTQAGFSGHGINYWGSRTLCSPRARPADS